MNNSGWTAVVLIDGGGGVLIMAGRAGMAMT